MGRHKKKFDKKGAHKFVLMHRSQQDPMYYMEGGGKLVLHPADPKTARALAEMGLGSHLSEEFKDIAVNYAEDMKKATKKKSGELREVDELGLPIDGYDYHQHLAAIDGSGTFVGHGKVYQPSESLEDGDEVDALERTDKSKAKSGLDLPAEVFSSGREHARMLEAITLNPDKMDPELRYLLEEDDDFGDEDEFEAEDPEWEENKDALDDNFMEQLLAAEEEGAGEDDENAFDYDAHIARLMAQAAKEDGLAFSDDEDDDDEYVEIDEEEMFENAGKSRKVRDIDVQFEKLLEAEYGDEEIGELDHAAFDERVAGTLDTKNPQVQEMLISYMMEKAADHTRTKEIGASKENLQLKDKSTSIVHKIEETNAENEANAQLQDGEEQEDPYDARTMLREFGYEEREKPKWDCETIVSTYSTFDNHPTLIRLGKPLKKKNNPQRKPRSNDDVNDDSDNEEEDDDVDADNEDALIPPPVPLAMMHNDRKNETKEEKKLRKKMIKQHQRMRREEKKSTKLMFKEERVKQQTANRKRREAAAPPVGTSTFKF